MTGNSPPQSSHLKTIENLWKFENFSSDTKDHKILELHTNAGLLQWGGNSGKVPKAY